MFALHLSRCGKLARRWWERAKCANDRTCGVPWSDIGNRRKQGEQRLCLRKKNGRSSLTMWRSRSSRAS